MKKNKLISLAFVMCLAMAISGAPAAKAAGFNGNRIIDDAVFNQSGSMEPGQIDAFLNSWPHSCISPANGFQAKVPTGYSDSGGFTFGGFGTAGQVISAASQAYGLNPRVLVVTLEKEQSLVTGRNSTTYCGDGEHKYAAALGYGCPDSGTTHSYTGVSLYKRWGVEHTSTGTTCVNSAEKAGFAQQVIRATWLFKFGQQRALGNTSWAVIQGSWDNSDDPPTCYGGPMTEGWRQRSAIATNTINGQPCNANIYYDGYTTIDSQATHMDTGATAALYWYTPHFHGNQVFFDKYNEWFGSTYTPDWGWRVVSQNTYADAAKQHSIDPANTLPNAYYYLVIKAKNEGSQTWNRGSVNVGVTPGGSSPLYDSRWLAPDRPATMVEAQAVPGATVTFAFWVHTPNSVGDVKQNFNLVSEGISWMDDIGMYYLFGVRYPQYKWQVQSQNAYSDSGRTVPADTSDSLSNKVYYLRIKAKNAGNTVWQKSKVKTGTTAPIDRHSILANAWMEVTRPATLNETMVYPGETGTFDFQVKTQAGVSKNYEYFSLVAEGIAWMNDPGLYYPVIVRAPHYNWQYVGQQAYTNSSKTTTVDTANLSTNTSYYLTLTAKNTGNTTWLKNTVKIGTYNPKDRTSPFYDASWLMPNRPATLNENQVAPGGTGTFGFVVHTPNAAGNYKEYYNLVADGISWMNDIGLYYPLNTH